MIHVFDIRESGQNGVTELVSLARICGGGDERTFFRRLGLLQLSTAVVDGGYGTETGDRWVDAKPLARRERKVLDNLLSAPFAIRTRS